MLVSLHRKEEDWLPLLEVSIEDPIWKPFPTDANALKDAITPQLMHHQERVHGSCTGEKKEKKSSAITTSSPN